MSRSRISVIAAISWLPLFALGSLAHAQSTTVYNAASDWAATYSTTTAALAATSATWGKETQDPSAWTAGAFSWNWTNIQASNPGGTQILTSYYTPNTVGDLTSGATVKATYTYTVPFQTYQFNPGQTFQQQVGITFTEQVASGYKPEKNGGSDSSAIVLPSGITSGGASSGYLQEVGAVKANSSVTAAVGFTTSAYNVSNSFSDGDGSVRAFVASVFYDYATTNANSTSLGGLNYSSSPTNNQLDMQANFGPSYIAWTAPTGVEGQNGQAVISVRVDELSASSDGSPSFFVMTSAGGPTAPIFSALAISGGNTTSTGGGGITDTTGGTYTDAGSTLTGGSLTVAEEIKWTSGTISVLPGETIYFVNDPMHVQSSSHGNHSTGDGNNPLGVQISVSYTPEPSSVVLMGIAGVGLAFAAWKRRRA